MTISSQQNASPTLDFRFQNVRRAWMLQSEYRVSPGTDLAKVIPLHQRSQVERRIMSNKIIYGCKLFAILDDVALIELTLEHAADNGSKKGLMDRSLLPLTLTMKLKLNSDKSGTTWN